MFYCKGGGAKRDENDEEVFLDISHSVAFRGMSPMPLSFLSPRPHDGSRATSGVGGYDDSPAIFPD
jgi:hypothetical protein